MTSWKDLLQDHMPVDLAQEIDVFEGQMRLRQQDKLAEKVFAETRLRQGVYGQRYDNGERHDGIQVQSLDYPSKQVKGPNTLWDAPGMQRIKIPFGGITPEQLEVMGQLAEEYADDILHVTTRQDIQLHYLHIDDTPDLMRRLAAVGITTHEACGNVVRNVTACPLAGVCRTQAFDVTPYSKALADFLLGHPDAQDFGRKFKVAFSGCADEACGLVKMHDLGLLARVQEVDGQQKRGFDVYVGGGLGTVPQQAKLLAEFVSEAEILPLAQAICRVFARLGEKKNRNRARLKFLIGKLGIESFRELVAAELNVLPPDEQWSAYMQSLIKEGDSGEQTAVSRVPVYPSPGYQEWARTNLYPQRQTGFYTVTINLPLGDLSSTQAYQLADIARQFAADDIRLTVEQNIVLRFVKTENLPQLYLALKAIHLGDAGAGTIVDITTCPGTDTCKLGIASSRGLTGELRTRLVTKSASLPDAIKNLRIKVSGCFNSCGQHHVADIGFFGNSRRRNNRTVPHFQVVLGGRWRENAGSYGLAVGAVPSKSVPAVLDAITDRYVAERGRGEHFQDWVARLGKRQIKEMLRPFQEVPLYQEAPAYYSDWGDPREYSIGDIGIGECAGEVVSLFSFEIAKAEGVHFDALIALDDRDYPLAEARAYESMILAARALVRNQFLDVGSEPDVIVSEFKHRYYDTQLFFDPFAKGKFGRYLLSRHASYPNGEATEESAYQFIEEAQLFIEAAHAADARLASIAEEKI